MLAQAINILNPEVRQIMEFSGLNRQSVVSEGEMSDMLNLTSDGYPVLRPRKRRAAATVPTGATPVSILGKYDKLAMIAKVGSDYKFYYDGALISAVNDLTEDTFMVSINTRICFFPQKKCYHLVNHTYDPIELHKTSTNPMQITTTLYDTKLYPGDISGFNVDDCIDIAGTLDFVYFEDQTGTAMNLTLTYYKKGTAGYYIVVPTADTWNNGTGWYLRQEDSKELSTSVVIEGIDATTNCLILPANCFAELAEVTADAAELSNASIDRDCPDLDFVMESNNRLWGVSNADNTIYASKLGDPMNWKYFQGTSADSYYAEQGTDGEWTGCAPYGQHLCFFKENSISRVYGTAPSSYQTSNILCPGIEKGSSKSAVVINDIVLYKSNLGIMAYQGNTPYKISARLGDKKFGNVAAGTDGIKYYMSADYGDHHEFLVCDVERAMWHKEDNMKATCFTKTDGMLHFIAEVGQSTTVQIVNSETPTEQSMEWMATFGPFEEYVDSKKIMSKLSMRLELGTGADADVYLSLDEGTWEKIYEFDGFLKGGRTIPIVPRRCDRFSFKIVGHGYFELKDLTRRRRIGTGGML